MLPELRNLDTTPRALRKFGLVVGAALLIFAAITSHRHPLLCRELLGIAVALIVSSAFCPRILKWIYLPWMAAAFFLGAIISTVLLTAFFYSVVTPIGLLARICGKDFLNRQRDPKATSYWSPRSAKKKTTSDSFEFNRCSGSCLRFAPVAPSFNPT